MVKGCVTPGRAGRSASSSPATSGSKPVRSSNASAAASGGPRGRLGALSSPEQLDVVMMRLRVIGEPTRVLIMALLDREGPASVQELTDRLPSTHQNISKHLRVLFQAGMVGRRKDRNHVRYELADWSALWLVEQVAASVADRGEADEKT